MALADEIRKLDELRQSGALSEEEYARAKARVIEGGAVPPVQTASPYAVEPAQPAEIERETCQWAMILHLSLLAGFVIPYGGLIIPIVIWQFKKSELPGIDPHGKVVVNWIISLIIYSIICIPLCFILIGFFLLLALAVLHVIFPIVGGLKASSGEVWAYPLSIPFLT
jgi:uncharacterized protein